MTIVTTLPHELKSYTKKSRKPLNSFLLPDHIGIDGTMWKSTAFLKHHGSKHFFGKSMFFKTNETHSVSIKFI